eukprot:snap_masked-scaffold_5-processed-gene-5.30-mRNA-1 protein AED:1.00 eAED:1.00 QI:0/0/0/0/1/1/2/0/64
MYIRFKILSSQLDHLDAFSLHPKFTFFKAFLKPPLDQNLLCKNFFGYYREASLRDFQQQEPNLK